MKWTSYYYFRLMAIAIGLFLLWGTACNQAEPREETRILVFSKTNGYRHASIGAGKLALLKMGEEKGFAVDTTEDAAAFTEENLAKYSTVVFLNTTKDVLDHRQQADFMRYIQAGGGFLGIHAATDTEYHWPWYNRLVGAYFSSHPSNPNVLEGKMDIVNKNHISTSFFGEKTSWTRKDEFYNFKDIYHGEPDGIIPLIQIDESSYEGGTNGDFHPMSWYHDFDGGRSFYTNFGHTPETFSEPEFLEHLWGGLQYAIGQNLKLDYSKAKALRVPEENRFLMKVLAENLNEPGELEVRKDGTILFTQRRGQLQKYDPQTQNISTIAELDVYTGNEDGLVGMALDPNYDKNNWIYLYYAPAGDEPKFHLSRFDLIDDKLLLETEKVVLVVPVQRDECCHTGGSIEFDAKGNLYLSTGDDTNPFDTRYAPIDERPGRGPWDAQKSSGNTNDLRGKILRITPTAEGGYTIPDGNLFPKDGSVGRPEVYVMGCRNPYRIHVDHKTGYVYWGDVGPDARIDSSRGSKGFDEVNQARKPGFFGWPLFIGDNQPYRDVDFATGEYKELFDPAGAINNSPNNTGAEKLPPAQKAFIWYPYVDSRDFPIVEKGGRNAMAGPVYYSDMFKGVKDRFPNYYDGKFFIYDFMRDWILLVTMNESGDLQTIEHFLPNLKLSSPMDMQFGPDGALYILEYGTQWFAQNQDARLIRIDYSSDNRAPVAYATADITVGAAPLEVGFSAVGSFDHDSDDRLDYQWQFSDDADAIDKGIAATYTYTKAGIYRAKLTVTDRQGKTGSSEITIQVGNDPPKIDLDFAGNQSFFWANKSIPYSVNVTDKEDGSLQAGGIDPSAVTITFDFLEQSEDATLIAQGHEAMATAGAIAMGEALIAEAGCIACHNVDKAVVGPGYTDVAKKYEGRSDAIAYLTDKIIKGGSGVWGGQVMPAQIQLEKSQAQNIAAFIMSLNEEKPQPEMLSPSGSIRANKHTKDGSGSKYIFAVSYKDKGGEVIGPLRATKTITLHSARAEAELADLKKSKSLDIRSNNQQNFEYVRIRKDGYMGYPSRDMTAITRLTIRYAAEPVGTVLEIRTGSPTGKLLASWNVPPTGGNNTYKEANISIEAVEGFKQLYYVLKNDSEGISDNEDLIRMDWIYMHAPGANAFANK